MIRRRPRFTLLFCASLLLSGAVDVFRRMCSARFLILKLKNWIPKTCIQSDNCQKCSETLKLDLFVSDFVSNDFNYVFKGIIRVK